MDPNTAVNVNTTVQARTTEHPCVRVVLVLVCGLPGAGKTRLLTELEALHTRNQALVNDSIQLQTICFDQLLLQPANEAENQLFDVEMWKFAQHEMLQTVKTRLIQQQELIQKAPPQHVDEVQPVRVLLVEDVFHYASMRKRMFHIAVEVGCGFGILFVNPPVEICAARNAARIGAAAIPTKVFARLAAHFEPPNGAKQAFELNTVCVSNVDTDLALEPIQSALQTLCARAHHVMDKAQATRHSELQRQADQARTKASFVHAVDLELRKRISCWMQQERFRNTEAAHSYGSGSMGRVWSQQRKLFLEELRAKIQRSTPFDAEKDMKIGVERAIEEFEARLDRNRNPMAT